MAIDLLEKLGQGRKAAGNEVNYCCPFCVKRGKDEDTGYHLYYNTVKKAFYCQRCGARGYYNELVEEDYGKKSLDELETLLLEDDKSDIRDYEHFSDYDEVVYDVNLPRTMRHLVKQDKAYNYLINRKFTDDDIHNWNIMLDSGWKYPRIVFPDFRNNKPIYWVSRKYIDGDESPKYMNGGFKWKCGLCGSLEIVEFCEAGRLRRRCSVCQDSNLIVNINTDARARGYIFGLFKRIEEGSFIKNPYVIVTEGPSSCIATDNNSVCTLGKGLTGKQLEVLCSLGVEICFALDSDALREILKYVSDLVCNRFQTVSVITMRGDEDPGSLGRDGMQRRFDNRFFIKNSEDFLQFSYDFI